MKSSNIGRAEQQTHDAFALGAGGRCRIRTRVVGFEARQDIQATLIARIPPELAPFLNKAGGFHRTWAAHSLAFQQDARPVAVKQRCH